MQSLVLALNPSVDVEWRVQRVRWEEKNAVISERRWPGGKGVNVARWLKHLGSRPQLVIPLGGQTGEEMASGLRAEGIPASVVPVGGNTRTNVIVTSAEGGQLRFNPLGPKLSRGDWSNILCETRRELKRTSVIVLSGSLPLGLPLTAYSKLVRVATAVGVKTLLDCDGRALAAAVKAHPFLLKPNLPELSQWCGRTLRTESAIRKAALDLAGVSGGWVLVSLGGKGGLLVNRREACCYQAAAPAVQTVNTVGAGDALLAAVAREIQRNSTPQEWLRSGVATGTAATQCLAGVLPQHDLVYRIASRVKLR